MQKVASRAQALDLDWAAIDALDDQQLARLIYPASDAQVSNQFQLPGWVEVLQELKRRMPEKRDIMVLLQDETSYQTLVSVVDRVRSYPTVQHLEVVQAERFPVISLGDSPEAAAGFARVEGVGAAGEHEHSAPDNRQPTSHRSPPLTLS